MVGRRQTVLTHLQKGVFAQLACKSLQQRRLACTPNKYLFKLLHCIEDFLVKQYLTCFQVAVSLLVDAHHMSCMSWPKEDSKSSCIRYAGPLTAYQSSKNAQHMIVSRGCYMHKVHRASKPNADMIARSWPDIRAAQGAGSSCAYLRLGGPATESSDPAQQKPAFRCRFINCIKIIACYHVSIAGLAQGKLQSMRMQT